MSKLVNMKRISLKNNPDINEAAIQAFIFENPEVLGLGNLTAIQREKSYENGGRLDMLLADEDNSRYEVEIQLGATDPSHIIRTIEYWDNERKKYPQHDHCAVIVAEEITGRFMNVISLFNDYIRDLLRVNHNVNDQTRQGDSENGYDAGEIDIQILDASGLPLVMVEGMKLDSLLQQYLKDHIDKVLVNYDPNGCPYVFLLIYTTVTGYDEFYRNLLNYLEEFEFPYERQTDIKDLETGYTELRHAQTVLLRSEKYVRVHFYVAHIRKKKRGQIYEKEGHVRMGQSEFAKVRPL